MAIATATILVAPAAAADGPLPAAFLQSPPF